MDVMGVFGPLLLCGGVIVAVAVVYFVVTALRDRSRERQEARRIAEARAHRRDPRQPGAHRR